MGFRLTGMVSSVCEEVFFFGAGIFSAFFLLRSPYTAEPPITKTAAAQTAVMCDLFMLLSPNLQLVGFEPVYRHTHLGEAAFVLGHDVALEIRVVQVEGNVLYPPSAL